MKRAALLILSLLLLAVIIARSVGKVNTGEPETRSAETRAVELSREDISLGEYKQFRTTFLVPVDFTYEEVKAHVNEYSEAMKAEYGDVYALILYYYDDEAYLHDTPVANVLWAPYGRFLIWYSPYPEVEIGDYSEHIACINDSMFSVK